MRESIPTAATAPTGERPGFWRRLGAALADMGTSYGELREQHVDARLAALEREVSQLKARLAGGVR